MFWLKWRTRNPVIMALKTINRNRSRLQRSCLIDHYNDAIHNLASFMHMDFQFFFVNIGLNYRITWYFFRNKDLSMWLSYRSIHIRLKLKAKVTIEFQCPKIEFQNDVSNCLSTMCVFVCAGNEMVFVSTLWPCVSWFLLFDFNSYFEWQMLWLWI